ncbi:MAG: hypothetical protein FWC40_04075 [Proteobacteria bacterium]|nr:hypothetical protein [Pseudomonadota bacterium]
MWNYHNSRMNEAFEAGDYQEALVHARTLEGICPVSPIVNYVTSEIYRELKDDAQSLVYLRRATSNLYEWDVSSSVVQRMWSRRVEVEAAQSALAASAATEDKQRETLSVLQAAADSSSIQGQIDYLNTLKWTGTGIAAGGAVLAIAGGVLVGVFHTKAQNELNDLSEDNLVSSLRTSNWSGYNNGVQAGYGLLAGGLAMGLTGSVFAILTHLKIVELESQADLKFSLQASPTGVGVTMTF